MQQAPTSRDRYDSRGFRRATPSEMPNEEEREDSGPGSYVGSCRLHAACGLWEWVWSIWCELRSESSGRESFRGRGSSIWVRRSWVVFDSLR